MRGKNVKGETSTPASTHLSNKYSLLTESLDMDVLQAKSMDEKIDLLVAVCVESKQQLKLFTEKMDSLVETIKNLKSEVKCLKEKTTELETANQVLRESVNDQQQHSRNWCVRVNNLCIPEEEVKKFGHINATRKVVFEKIFSNILQHPDVKKKCEMPIENFWDVVENAHTLPGKKGSKYPPTIIARFRERSVRNLILENKNITNSEGVKLLESTVSSCEKEKGIQRYSITADLTQINHGRMAKLISSGKFDKVWHLDGRVVKFFLKGQKGKPYTAKLSDKTADEIIDEAKSGK